MPGEIAWLVGEQMPDGRRRYYFTNHSARISLKALVPAIRKRWGCEQAHLQLKQELGLDHFEGRSYRGLAHHTFLTMLSFAFLQYLRLKTIDNEAIEFMKLAYTPQKLRPTTVKASKGKNHKGAERSATVTVTPDGPACPHCHTLLNDSLMSTLQQTDHLSPVQ